MMLATIDVLLMRHLHGTPWQAFVNGLRQQQRDTRFVLQVRFQPVADEAFCSPASG
jgi:hypothetical protein